MNRRNLLAKAAWAAPALTVLLAAQHLPMAASAATSGTSEPPASKKRNPRPLKQRHPTRQQWIGQGGSDHATRHSA